MKVDDMFAVNQELSDISLRLAMALKRISILEGKLERAARDMANAGIPPNQPLERPGNVD